VTLEEALVTVWRQALIESAGNIELGGRQFPVCFTPRQGLRQIDFVFHGQSLRGLEQNPNTASRWAALARSGAKVMQFLSHGRYIAVVADGKLTAYSSLGENSRKIE
jgi:NADPH-dependent ferric siderophore reductase